LTLASLFEGGAPQGRRDSKGHSLSRLRRQLSQKGSLKVKGTTPPFESKGVKVKGNPQSASLTVPLEKEPKSISCKESRRVNDKRGKKYKSRGYFLRLDL